MNHIGKDTSFQVGERTYTLSRYTRNIHEEWVAWARDRLPPRPRFDYAEAKEAMKDLPPNLQEIILREAIEQARADKAEQDATEARKIEELKVSRAGVYKLFGLLLKKHHPNLSPADIEALYDQTEEEQGYQFLPRKLSECAGVSEEEYQALEKQWLQKAGMLPQQESTFRPFASVAPAR